MRSLWLLATVISTLTGTIDLNFDRNVTDFMEKFIPATHKPIYTTQVYVFSELYNLIDVNERAETITTKLWMFIGYFVFVVPEDEWTDRLGDKVYEIHLDKSSRKAWEPDIVILNSVSVLEDSYSAGFIRKYYPDGVFTPLVTFPKSRTVVTTCSFDVTDFPFDNQLCDIDIGPWWSDFMYDDEGLSWLMMNPDTERNSSQMNLLSYQPNSQWEIKKVTYEFPGRFAMHDEPKIFDMLRYTIHMKRRPQFYVYTLIIPCMLLSFLTVLSVYLPVESGEKIGLGITIMLAQVVNLLILSGIVPSSSTNFPFLGKYFLVTIIIIGASLIYNTILINYYFQDKSLWCSFKISMRARTVRKVLPESIDNPRTVDKTMNQSLPPSPDSNNGNDVGNGKTSEPDNDAEERRKAICCVADKLAGTIFLVAVSIVHAIYFMPHM